jgi:hypothetical protein
MSTTGLPSGPDHTNIHDKHNQSHSHGIPPPIPQHPHIIQRRQSNQDIGSWTKGPPRHDNLFVQTKKTDSNYSPSKKPSSTPSTQGKDNSKDNRNIINTQMDHIGQRPINTYPVVTNSASPTIAKCSTPTPPASSFPPQTIDINYQHNSAAENHQATQHRQTAFIFDILKRYLSTIAGCRRDIY